MKNPILLFPPPSPFPSAPSLLPLLPSQTMSRADVCDYYFSCPMMFVMDEDMLEEERCNCGNLDTSRCRCKQIVCKQCAIECECCAALFCKRERFYVCDECNAHLVCRKCICECIDCNNLLCKDCRQITGDGFFSCKECDK